MAPSSAPPTTFRGRRRVACDDNPATLVWRGRAVPANDEPELAFEEIRALIENDQVVRIALEALLVAFLLAAGDVDLTIAEPPALKLAVVAVAAADDRLEARDDLERVLVDPAKDQEPAIALLPPGYAARSRSQVRAPQPHRRRGRGSRTGRGQQSW
jgi:hypothetical protein